MFRKFYRFFASFFVACFLGTLCGLVVVGCADSSGSSPTATAADDHGNDAQSATTLKEGVSNMLTGEIETAGDRDAFGVLHF